MRSWTRSVESAAGKRLVRASTPSYSGFVLLCPVRPLSREFEERQGPELESPHSGLFAQAKTCTRFAPTYSSGRAVLAGFFRGCMSVC